MGSSIILEDLFAEAGMTYEQAQKMSRESMLDGNPSIHHNAFLGNKIKYEIGDTVMITKYSPTPDICGVVLEVDAIMLKILTVDGNDEQFIRKDGVIKIDMEDDEAWNKVKTKEESLAFYRPRRQQRELEISLAIALMKLQTHLTTESNV